VIRSNLRAAAGLLIVLSGLAAGCQWLGHGMTESDRLAEKRRQRADAFARSIDQQHEQADLVAARDLWQRGDHESCKRRLNELLTRNPEQLDARLLLADVLLDENQAQEGIRVLKPAEAAHRDDARVQYTMGLLLDASGSQEGARSHYQAAALLEPGNEVYTVSYNEASTSANAIAAPGSRENQDLKESDPSVPPPLPDNAEAARLNLPRAEPGRAGPDVRGGPELATPRLGATAGLSSSADSTAGQANRGAPGAQANRQPAPGSTPQDFPLPVILPAAAPLAAVGDDQPGPQVVRQDLPTPPQIAPLPPGDSAPESTTLSESASSPPMGPPEKCHAPPLPSFFPQTSRDDPPPQAPQGDRPLVAARSSTPNFAPRPELPMPMILALPSSPAAASQPSRLPLETAAAKKLQPEGESPSQRFVVPAENSGAIEISGGSGEAARADRTAHTEPIDPAESAGATVGSANRADAGTRGRGDAGTTAGATAGLPSHAGSTVVQPSSGTPSPRLVGTAGQAGSGTQALDPAGSAAAEDLLRQGAEALSAGKTDVATAFFREAAASRPHDPQIPISAAVAALRQNHPEAAVDLLEAAAGRFPTSAAVYRALGTACYRRTDYRAAQSALRQALLLDKANPLSYFIMGCTLVKLGQQPAADECFRQARLLDPKYAVPRQPGQMP
jgi:tetratricopeptide (TPR) repeat protein